MFALATCKGNLQPIATEVPKRCDGLDVEGTELGCLAYALDDVER